MDDLHKPFRRWLAAIALALSPVAASGGTVGTVADLAAIGAMAHEVDLAIGEGSLQGRDRVRRDLDHALWEQHLWATKEGAVRKYRLEYGVGTESLEADYYYDPQGSLRLLVHASDRELANADAAEGGLLEEAVQQELYFDAAGSLMGVLYRRELLDPETGKVTEERKELPRPDESLWPVRLVWAPEKDLLQGSPGASTAAEGSPLRKAALPPADLLLLMSSAKELQLVDVREPEEYAQGHLKGARLLPLGDLEARWKELDRHRPLVVVCRGGRRSAEALKILRAHGFDQATQLTGGLLAWQAAGLTLVH